ncbi:MAG: carboxymuconolactone decarboxylase family protein [Alphaproteobacteria bacterium]|nr:MAG: carboxymuconolactone decarboxylase family protein [Alphaproteobacteria bacterium]
MSRLDYPLHTPETAPEEARAILAEAEKGYGFLPNLLAVMAEAPALLKGYRTLMAVFDETSLSPIERQVVLLSVSAENECRYCVAAHSVIAAMQGVPDDVIQAIRNGRPIADSRLQALRRLSAAFVRRRGWPEEADIAAFLEAGYTRAQVLEVILGVGVKTLSNYTNHVAHTPLDAAFAKAEWTPAA